MFFTAIRRIFDRHAARKDAFECRLQTLGAEMGRAMRRRQALFIRPQRRHRPI
ncbi:hypothetical protein [Albidovulum inexpectatum]|nr:hypothetical protein [Albidovulum inexpectatum]